MSDDLTGRQVGHYRVDGVIGKGGMSVLYRATDVRLGRKVALKVIAEHLSGDPEFRERFVDEARNTSAIDHSHVVPLYDFGETGGLLYIAMRYVEGPDLASLIKGGPLAPPRALGLLGQVAGALDSVHSRGLVHLDVKPANVLVTTRESAGSEHAYLADFGLTRRGATGHRTSSGDFLGSPTYAAPEHLRGQPVDPRTDQYALACVLFACLTGRAPYRGTVPEVIQGHLDGAIPAASELVSVPSTVDDVLRRGMAKDPGSRFGCCAELVSAGRGALARASRPARPATAPAPSSRGPSSTGPSTTGPSTTGPSSAGPSSTGPSSIGPSSIGPSSIGPSDTGLFDTGQSRSGPPVRLRNPLPAQSASFATGAGRSNRWIVPVALASVAVIVLIVLLIGTGLGGG